MAFVVEVEKLLQGDGGEAVFGVFREDFGGGDWGIAVLADGVVIVVLVIIAGEGLDIALDDTVGLGEDREEDGEDDRHHGEDNHSKNGTFGIIVNAAARIFGTGEVGSGSARALRVDARGRGGAGARMGRSRHSFILP